MGDKAEHGRTPKLLCRLHTTASSQKLATCTPQAAALAGAPRHLSCNIGPTSCTVAGDQLTQPHVLLRVGMSGVMVGCGGFTKYLRRPVGGSGPALLLPSPLYRHLCNHSGDGLMLQYHRYDPTAMRQSLSRRCRLPAAYCPRRELRVWGWAARDCHLLPSSDNAHLCSPCHTLLVCTAELPKAAAFCSLHGVGSHGAGGKSETPHEPLAVFCKARCLQKLPNSGRPLRWLLLSVANG